MKKWMLIAVSLFCLISCAKKQETNITNDYEQKKGKIVLQSKEETPFYYIEMVKNDDIPILVFTSVGPIENYKYYLDLQKMYKDMKGVGDSLKSYLDENKQAGAIFINLDGPDLSNFVLNYLENTLYIPKYYDNMKYLLEKYKTVEIKNIKNDYEGLQYLLKNDFVTKTTEGYSDNMWKKLNESYHVYIDKDGKYNEFPENSGIKLLCDVDGKLVAK